MLNRRHPLAQGMTACYIPGASLSDLTGINGILVPRASISSIGISKSGPCSAQDGTTTTAGYLANLSVAAQFGSTGSLFWFGDTTTATLTNTAFHYVGHTQNSSADTTVTLTCSRLSVAQYFGTYWGANFGLATAYTTGTHSVATTFVTGSTSLQYYDGFGQGGGQLITSLTYSTPSPQFILGSKISNITASPDSTSSAGYGWSRVLTAQENYLLHIDPYQMIEPLIEPNWIGLAANARLPRIIGGGFF